MDIDRFIEQYHFLSNMVDAYNEFNKDVSDDERTFDVTLINNVKSIGGYHEKDYHVYEKLIRNLSSLLNNKYREMSKRDYCRFLYQWVYHTKKKFDINEYPLSMFYLASHANIVRNGGENICPYYSYDTTLEEPLNIIKLENFQEDMQTIESILKRENDSITSCQKYICECVNIYKKMHNEYCTHPYNVNKKRDDTCDKLRAFASAYMSYLFVKKEIKDKIPSLYDAESVPFSRCSTEEKERQLSVAGVSTPDSANEPGPRPGEGIAQSSTRGAEQSDNSIPFNTTSVVSAMAGIPPFLALIYKFTPVGNMFRRKNNKSANVFNNLDEEIEKELFYRRLENGTIKSSPERFNVAYGSV
ncbi:Plasmodium vivax Vir protein, putative [Plasmodium vivax]|uniref:Vir protein, putative n=1 Tax=Plasmodium vivax TaxID=5855 RepID=A0A1G4EF90_PLAVI|nr:Plasmodium vivax Vir protein, putative [Plasmodium vivax]